MTLPTGSFDLELLTARLELLRTLTVKIAADYDRTMSRARQLEANECLSDLAEHERQLMSVIELFMRDDVRACTVMDYAIVFFRLVLAKMRQGGQDFDDVKQLHKALSDEIVAQTFRTVLSKLEFPAREHLAIRVVLEALQHREWPASEVMTASPGGDAQISSALLYLRLQPDLDPVLGSSLQRALCAAHECVLSDLAISEVSCDVNINANDVRKDYAYADASIKYEDYADFERYWGKKCSDADRCSDRESCAAVEGVGNSGTVGGAEGKSREWRAQEDVAAADPLKGCSDGRERKASSRFTATAGEAGEGGQDVCEALAKSCKVSLEAGPERKTPADVQSRGGDQQDATPPPATGTAKDGEVSHPEKYRSAALDGSRFAPDTKLYVICYDASTSTQSDSVPDCADEAARGAANEKAREAHHVTKVSNENATGAEKTTTDVATETD